MEFRGRGASRRTGTGQFLPVRLSVEGTSPTDRAAGTERLGDEPKAFLQAEPEPEPLRPEASEPGSEQRPEPKFHRGWRCSSQLTCSRCRSIHPPHHNHRVPRLVPLGDELSCRNRRVHRSTRQPLPACSSSSHRSSSCDSCESDRRFRRQPWHEPFHRHRSGRRRKRT